MQDKRRVDWKLLVGRVPTFWAVKPNYTAASAELFVQKGYSNFETGYTWS